MIGAHYMNNWHSGRWSQWYRCHDGADMRITYPERLPLTGSLVDLGGTYTRHEGATFKPPDCRMAHKAPACTANGPTPCCNTTNNCLEDFAGHFSCPGGGDGFGDDDFTPVTPSDVGLQTVASEIATAAAHGVTFFGIECFGGLNGVLSDGDPVNSPHEDPYDTALPLFLMSEATLRQHNFSFSVNLMNHAQVPGQVGVYTSRPALWQKAISNVLRALESPSYLRICGRPYVTIGNGFDLVRQAGNASAAGVLLRQLSSAVVAAGHAEPLIGHGWLQAGQQYPSAGAMEAELGYAYDFTNSYAQFWYPPSERGSNRQPPVTQPALWANQQTIRQRVASNPVRHVPTYPMGFHPVSECGCWGFLSPSERGSWIPPAFHGCVTPRQISVPTAEDFGRGMRELWEAVVRSDRFGVWTGQGPYRSQPMATVYAWNEWTEAYPTLSPQRGTNYSLLQAFAAVWGGSDEERRHRVCGTVGLDAPACRSLFSP